MDTVRWNVAVSPETDQSLRIFLANQGRGKKGDLSKFIEEAVRSQIFELTAKQVKHESAAIGEEALNETINNALEWSRNK